MQFEAKYVFILNALEALFFGVSFVVAPVMIAEMVGPITLVVGVAGEVMAVHYGIALIALAILMLLIRNQPQLNSLTQNAPMEAMVYLSVRNVVFLQLP